MLTVLTFTFFTVFVAIYTWYKLKKENLSSKDGYFLGGRSLTGIVIAGSMLLTNIFSGCVIEFFDSVKRITEKIR